ncbi:hypothetical protein E2C01_025567 [Portunus trituberculatus]|uniref:Uncharacterized protein n=1 Tax=Portunus trituberculatus TaxID=210409 RepID=A0A5B7EGA3_PORTR|nr:hypothetical protein [Portunus trituberculatus]
MASTSTTGGTGEGKDNGGGGKDESGYFLDECETNSRTYLESQEIILSESVKFLVNTALSKVVKKGSESSSVPLSHPQSPTPPLITVTPDSKI